MIQINTLGLFVGMGIVSLGVTILWLLADKNPQKNSKKRKSQHK